MYFAIFYVEHSYYFPHFLPIYMELNKRALKCAFVLSDKHNIKLLETICKKYNLEFFSGVEHIYNIKSTFFILSNSYEIAMKLNGKTVFLEHGIGTKSKEFYYALEHVDIYLVEGSYKYNRLANLYPKLKHKLYQVGYSKFDPILNGLIARDEIIKRYHLDLSKKTILYAPTFFPSSIERMSKGFPKDFENYNILIKPHYFTLDYKRYAKQRKILSYWSGFENCIVLGLDEYDLTPLFAVSDLMISDESSAMFEFAVLDKPVISNRFYKLRFSYYLMPWKLSRRIDEGKDRYREMLYNASNYKEMSRLVVDLLENGLDEKSDIRKRYAKELCGELDGKASKRIVDLLESVAKHQDRA